jgi:hypothetical protein
MATFLHKNKSLKVGKYYHQVDYSIVYLGPIFRTFFQGKILGKIPRKFFPLKMSAKIGIFRGKSFEK